MASRVKNLISGRVFRAKIILFAGAGNVMRAMQDGLHPAQAAVARRADLFLGESCQRERHKRTAAFVQFQRSVHETCADNFARVRDIHEKVGNIAGRSTKIRVARTHHANALKQAELMVHLQAEVGDVGSGNIFENFNQRLAEIIRQLERSFLLPAGGDSFQTQGRELALDFIFDGEIQLRWFLGSGGGVK